MASSTSARYRWPTASASAYTWAMIKMGRPGESSCPAPLIEVGKRDWLAYQKDQRVKRHVLFDHDGVLVDTEFWYYKAGERALADIGLTLDKDQYLQDMNRGLGTWAQARAAGIDEQTISRQREVRDDYYQEYLRTEAIEIEGVAETLAEL